MFDIIDVIEGSQLADHSRPPVEPEVPNFRTLAVNPKLSPLLSGVSRNWQSRTARVDNVPAREHFVVEGSCRARTCQLCLLLCYLASRLLSHVRVRATAIMR